MAKKQDKPAPDSDTLAAEALLREADEQLRQDRLKALWDEWGATIIGTAFMIVLGTIAGVLWKGWQSSHRGDQTDLLAAALERPTIEAPQDLSDYYAGILALVKAGELDNPTAETLAPLYDTAADAGLPKEWDLLAEWGRLRTSESTAADYVALAEKRNNPFAPIILAEAAILKGQSGKNAEAMALLDQAAGYQQTQSSPTLQSYIADIRMLYQDKEEGPVSE